MLGTLLFKFSIFIREAKIPAFPGSYSPIEANVISMIWSVFVIILVVASSTNGVANHEIMHGPRSYFKYPHTVSYLNSSLSHSDVTLVFKKTFMMIQVSFQFCNVC